MNVAAREPTDKTSPKPDAQRTEARKPEAPAVDTAPDAAPKARPDAVPVIPAGAAPGAGGASRTGTDVMGNWMEVWTEIGRFTVQRLGRNVQTGQAILQCRTPFEAFAVEMQHFDQMMADYQAQASALAQVGCSHRHEG